MAPSLIGFHGYTYNVQRPDWGLNEAIKPTLRAFFMQGTLDTSFGDVRQLPKQLQRLLRTIELEATSFGPVFSWLDRIRRRTMSIAMQTRPVSLSQAVQKGGETM